MSDYLPISDPTLTFFLVLLIILISPIIMGKLRIPHIVGLVIAGVAVGQFGFNLLERDSSFELFGKIGLYYIMFLAGLEMDLESVKRHKYRMLTFGLLTFAIPFLLTFALAPWLLDYSLVATWLLACIMASNTLIAYPIIGRFGLQRHESVGLSVGGTMVALFISLVLLAVIPASAGEGGNDVLFWLLFLAKLAVYSIVMILVLPRVTRWFLRRYSDAVMQYIFVMSAMVLSAALSQLAGLEGIFGAFLSGLILSRYIPRLSALMNRIEFIGNAIFIPYFLIGVGMLINIRALFDGGSILWVVSFMVILGTLGKAAAAYLAGMISRIPMDGRHMMFGLTSAHAAGAIAMVMVGRHVETAPGEYLVGDDMLNGVVIMILFTCVISTIVTEKSARLLVLNHQTHGENKHDIKDEKILVPVKYPEVAGRLISTALMMRNRKMNRGLVALNVVYDDEKRQANQDKGRLLLEQVSKQATAADVRIQTQVRIAANIANGIKHAFKEFNASEIIMGMHIHKNVSPKFWGEFAQSLYNGLDRQITFVRLKQPLNTLRLIQVAVPSRAQYEHGFYRWLERLCLFAHNLECRITFHGRNDTIDLIRDYIDKQYPLLRAWYSEMEHWNELPRLAATILNDHLFVVVTARKGTVSYKNAMEKLPDEIEKHFSGANLFILFPDQYGERMDSMTFAEPQHKEEKSAYQSIIDVAQKVRRIHDNKTTKQ